MCGAVGREAAALHRPWLLLAEQLAAAGLPALRFDYPGTGDSPLDEGRPLTLADWTASVVCAAAWLRERTGVAEIALCGIRLGGALAMRAAPRIEGVAAAALLQPVISGRMFLREQEVLATLSDTLWMVKHPFEADGWWEAYGLRLSRAMHRELQAIEPADLDRRPFDNALILTSHEPRQAHLLADRLRRLGGGVHFESFPERAALMRDDLANEIPQQAFDRLVGWLAKDAPERPGPTDRPLPEAVITMPEFREIAVQFGPRRRLFGIYCAPADRTPSAAVVIYNTGAIPHYGQSRMGVTFARRLARRGIASLRVDLSGVGDSSPVSGHDRLLFSPAWQEEAHEAAEWVQDHVGTPVILFGVCSGAYAALQVARGNLAIGGLVLANMQHFIQDAKMPLQAQHRSPRTPRQYLRRLRSPAIWRRLLSGGIPVRNLSRSAFRSANRLMRSAEIDAKRRMVRRWFANLNARQVEVQVVYGKYDGGLDDLELYFGPGGKHLKALRNTRLAVLEGADHSFSHYADREQLFALLLEMAVRRISASTLTGGTDAAGGPLDGDDFGRISSP